MEYLGSTRPHKELEVRDALQDMGIPARVALRAEFVRKGYDRRARLSLAPYFPSLIFVHLDDSDFRRIRNVRGLNSRWYQIAGQREGRRIGHAAQVDRFFERADEEVRAAVEIDLQAEKRGQLMHQFKAGQAIQALQTSFRETVMRFVRMEQTAHDAHPYVVAEMDLMGQVAQVKLDPLDVRAAE